MALPVIAAPLLLGLLPVSGMALPVIAAPLLLGLLTVSGMALPVIAAPLLLGLLAVSGASGGVPRSCPPNTICLKDYNKEEFHRLTIDCRGLTAILDEYGDIFGRNVSYNNVSRCITRRDGILADCAVTETDYDGRKTKVPITYNCTEVFTTSTAPTTTPADLMPTLATPYSRHHWFLAVVAVVGAFVVSVFLWIFYGKCLQEQIAPQKVLVPSPP